jgi:MerR family transcriptional regulator, thiopeptide resistance regulator
MDASGNDQAWKVGTLAKATGLTVRALHHYDHIGLLSPSMRTTAGHRLYTADDVARLYRIRLLRSLGFPLEQIVSVLEDPGWQLAAAVRRHLEHTRDKAAITGRLCRRLAVMADELDRQDRPASDQLFSALEEMTMLDTTVHSVTGLLVYDDLDAAHSYIVRVYGLTPGPIHRDADGRTVLAELHAGDQTMAAPGGDGLPVAPLAGSGHQHDGDNRRRRRRALRPQRPGRRRDPESTGRPALRGTRIRRAGP